MTGCAFCRLAKAASDATDALSGVAEPLISFDGAPVCAACPRAVPGDRRRQTPDALLSRSIRWETPKRCRSTHSGSTPLRRRPSLPSQGPAPMRLWAWAHAFSVGRRMPMRAWSRFCYRLDDGAEQIYEKPLALDVLAEGSHQIQFYAEDRVGERGKAAGLHVRGGPPAAEYYAIDPRPTFSDKGVRYVTPQTEIELASRDAVAGPTPVRYGIDGAPATECLCRAISPAGRFGDSSSAHRGRRSGEPTMYR